MKQTATTIRMQLCNKCIYTVQRLRRNYFHEETDGIAGILTGIGKTTRTMCVYFHEETVFTRRPSVVKISRMLRIRCINSRTTDNTTTSLSKKTFELLKY